MALSQHEREYAQMMYEEHAEHARLHEELRTNATGIFVALISGLLAATIFGPTSSFAVGIMICIISILGCLLTWMHYRRSDLHLTLLKEFRDQLAAGLPVAGAVEGKRKEYEKRHPMSQMSLHGLFVAVFVVTLLIGIAISLGLFRHGS
jgi:Na+/melibiose symporter-like transporter